MFGIIKTLFVLLLVAGVIFLGGRIHQKSVELSKDSSSKQKVVQEKISNLKKDVIEKTSKLGEVYEQVNQKLDNAIEEELKKATNKKKDAQDIDNRLSSKSVKDTKKMTIDPVDEEDRKITEEIFNAKTDENVPKEFTPESKEHFVDKATEDIPLQISRIEDKEPTPIDLNKASEIRELYLQAIETLDFN